MKVVWPSGGLHERSIFFAVLPAARRGILAAVILGIGWAIGETMAVIMVAGNQGYAAYLSHPVSAP